MAITKTSFTSGQSGNPAGRPKGVRNKNLIEKAINIFTDADKKDCLRAIMISHKATLKHYGLRPSQISEAQRRKAFQQLRELNNES